MAPRHREVTVAIDRTTDGPSGGVGLPALLTPLVGREDAIARGCDLVNRSRLVTLTGPGGIGKTQLALAIGHQLADRFPDGRVFIELAAVSEPALVLPTIATALGLRENIDKSIEQHLKSYLRRREMLLILDNAEHLLNAASDIAVLLAESTHLRILVTSRSPLNLRGEHEFDVPPLVTPPRQHALSSEELTDYPAIALFVRQAQATGMTFARTDMNVQTIAAICTRLDGMPLAIELAASRVRVLTPGGILTRLDEQLLLLTGGPRDQPPRLQTMRSAIAWSYDLLDDGQQTLFRQLAVFSGGWTLEAANAICKPQETALEAMSSLIACSLVRWLAQPGGEARFTMLEPIRQFALEQLVASGELDALRSQHADVFLALAEEAAPHLDWRDQQAWMKRLDPEHDNFRAALAWLLERRDIERGSRFVGALSWFWNIRGYFSEAWTQTQAFLNLPQADVPTPARGRALAASAHALYVLGDRERAQSIGEEALAINTATGDRAGRARILIPLIMIALEAGETQRHRRLADDLLDIARERDDHENIARALIQLGWGALGEGDMQQAFALFSEALELSNRLENRATAAMALGCLGDVHFRGGDFVLAATAYRDSLTIDVDLNFAWRIAQGLERLAAVACANADWQRSTRLYAASAALTTILGVRFPASRLDVLNRDLVALRSGLGEEPFQSAWKSGQLMSITDAVAYALESDLPPAATQTRGVGNLSPRECDVLRLIAAGQSNKEIAADLCLSIRTVERHITNIYAKIDARGKADATAWALRHGIV